SRTTAFQYASGLSTIGHPCGHVLLRMSKIEGLLRIVLSRACSTTSWKDACWYGQLVPLPVPGGRRQELALGGGVGVGVVGWLDDGGGVGGGVGVGTGTGTMTTGTGAGPVTVDLVGGSSSVMVWHETPNSPSTAAATRFRFILPPFARNWVRIVRVIHCQSKEKVECLNPHADRLDCRPARVQLALVARRCCAPSRRRALAGRGTGARRRTVDRAPRPPPLRRRRLLPQLGARLGRAAALGDLPDPLLHRRLRLSAAGPVPAHGGRARAPRTARGPGGRCGRRAPQGPEPAGLARARAAVRGRPAPSLRRERGAPGRGAGRALSAAVRQRRGLGTVRRAALAVPGRFGGGAAQRAHGRGGGRARRGDRDQAPRRG